MFSEAHRAVPQGVRFSRIPGSEAIYRWFPWINRDLNRDQLIRAYEDLYMRDFSQERQESEALDFMRKWLQDVLEIHPTFLNRLRDPSDMFMPVAADPSEEDLRDRALQAAHVRCHVVMEQGRHDGKAIMKQDLMKDLQALPFYMQPFFDLGVAEGIVEQEYAKFHGTAEDYSSY